MEGSITKIHKTRSLNLGTNLQQPYFWGRIATKNAGENWWIAKTVYQAENILDKENKFVGNLVKHLNYGWGPTEAAVIS